ncbi:MAG: AAA family ATPase, partial [bacterium]
MSSEARPASLVRVLKALKGEGCEIRGADGYFMATCPAHPDGNPSMSVKHDGDRTLVNCFAGCDFEDIRRALGLGAADFYDVRPGESDNDPSAPESDDPTSRLIDWEQLLSSAPVGADWLVYPLIEVGRATTLYAPAGEGKSLVSLEIAAGLASGRDAFRQPMRKMDVVYWDYENDAQLLASRVRNMDYKADDLKRLHYYSFPESAGLDTK